MNDVVDTGPLDWRIAITDGNGRPTNEFMRRWNTQRNNNGLITPVTVENGPPGNPVPANGSEYIDVSTTPPTFYVASNGVWTKVGVYKFTQLSDVPDTYTGDGGDLVQINSSATGLQFSTLSAVLDSLGSAEGSIIYRGPTGWVVLAPGTATYVLQTNGAGAAPTWVAQTGGGGGSGITSLTAGTGITLTPNPITSTGVISTTSTGGHMLPLVTGDLTEPAPSFIVDVYGQTIGVPL